MTEKTRQAELQGASVVALGSFNPAILHPLWFSAHGLLPAAEAENAQVDVIHKEVAVFSAEWFSLQVVADRFALETKDPTKYLPLRDLAVGTFKLLEHTPIHAFGLNTTQHFRMESEEQWHAFGDYYAPKDSWSALLEHPGMRCLIIEGKRKQCDADRVQIKIEPSQGMPQSIFIHVNEHYGPRGEPASKNRMADFIHTLGSSWDGFLAYSDHVSQHLLTEFRKTNG